MKVGASWVTGENELVSDSKTLDKILGMTGVDKETSINVNAPVTTEQ